MTSTVTKEQYISAWDFLWEVFGGSCCEPGDETEHGYTTPSTIHWVLEEILSRIKVNYDGAPDE